MDKPKKTILLVDNHPKMLEGIASHIKRESAHGPIDYTVLTSPSYADACKQIDAHPEIGALVTDYKLELQIYSNMQKPATGIDVLQHLRDKGSSAPAIVMSFGFAAISGEEEARLKQLGGEKILKDESEQLMTMLNAHFGNQKLGGAGGKTDR